MSEYQPVREGHSVPHLKQYALVAPILPSSVRMRTPARCTNTGTVLTLLGGKIRQEILHRPFTPGLELLEKLRCQPQILCGQLVLLRRYSINPTCPDSLNTFNSSFWERRTSKAALRLTSSFCFSAHRVASTSSSPFWTHASFSRSISARRFSSSVFQIESILEATSRSPLLQ